MINKGCCHPIPFITSGRKETNEKRGVCEENSTPLFFTPDKPPTHAFAPTQLANEVGPPFFQFLTTFIHQPNLFPHHPSGWAVSHTPVSQPCFFLCSYHDIAPLPPPDTDMYIFQVAWVCIRACVCCVYEYRGKGRRVLKRSHALC